MIIRAEEGCYPRGALKEVPSELIGKFFYEEKNCLRIKDVLRKNISFRLQDIRKEMPGGKFHLIFCRYVAFTYFAKELQKKILNKLFDKLYPGGFLIFGSNENLPEDTASLKQYKDKSIYKKI